MAVPLSPQRPTTDHACLTLLTNSAPLHPHPRCLPFPKASIQSGRRRQHAGAWFSSSQGLESVEKWDITAGWPGPPRSHHTPLGEGLLSPKTCLTQFTTKQLVHSSFITCSNIFEGQQAEENRKLKAISSQRRAPEFPCPFRSAPTRLWTNPCCLPAPRKSHPSRDSSSHWAGKWAAAGSQEAVPPPGR